MKGFLADLYLRPSCYQCAAKSGKSGSDITIADFWGIQLIMPELDDDKGLNLIVPNTPKGKQTLVNISQITKEIYYEDAIRYNNSLNRSVPPHVKRNFFFQELYNDMEICKLITLALKPSFFDRFKNKIKQIVQ